MDIPQEIWAEAPWSYSKANLAHNCPLAYHKKYVAKEKPVAAEAKATTVGIVVHKILEWTDMGMTVDQAYEKAKEIYELTYEMELEVLTFRSAVVDWVNGLARFCEERDVKEKYPEKKLALNGEFKLTGYYAKDCLIRGNIDLTLYTGNGRAVVIDHKSGALPKLEHHQHQLELYCIMADAFAFRLLERKLLNRGLRSACAALHAVNASKNVKGTRTVWMPEYNIAVVRTLFRERLIAFLQHAASVATQADPQPKKGWMCNYCDYRPVCPMQK